MHPTSIKIDHFTELGLIGALTNFNDDAHDDVFEQIPPVVARLKLQ